MTSSPRSLIAGKYELVAPIGEGGMASVWRGITHGAAGFTRKVAIKRVLPQLASDEKFAALFVEEARVVSDLVHPNIVQVHDFDRDEAGQYFIVMEWVEGTDLGRYIHWHLTRREWPPWQFVTAFMVEVLRGLGHAHERRGADGAPAPVIHRDVTPSNVLIGVNGVVKLADFGLARAMDRVSMTRPGTVKGKLGYMAPEVMHGSRVSPQSDLYCAGIILWESLAGRRLFHGENDLAIVMKVREGRIPSLAAIRPDLPETLLEVVETALAKDPALRFETARAMRRALTSVLRLQRQSTDPEILGESVRRTTETADRG